MSADDRRRWDDRYLSRTEDSEAVADRLTPSGLVGFEALLPTSGRALDVACGQGQGSVWLADRGLEVVGVDVSPVAISHARLRAVEAGVDDRCHFEAHDLDGGLPEVPPVELMLCHRFNAPALDESLLARLVPGGVLALTALSEVGAEPGSFRVRAGELLSRFAGTELLGHSEEGGQATIVVRVAGPQPHGRLD